MATPTQSRTVFYVLAAVFIAVGAGGIYYKMHEAAPAPVAVAPSATASKMEGFLEGKPDAPITITEFADFECPGCKFFATVTEPQVRAKYIETGLVNIRYMIFPLEMHPNTMSASLAAVCADDQGKFWAMHDTLFAKQNEWNGQATTNPKKVIAGYLPMLGLDAAAWNTCFDSQKLLAKIDASRAAGLERGIRSTPTFIIGDKMYNEVLTFARVQAILDSLPPAKPATTKP